MTNMRLKARFVWAQNVHSQNEACFRQRQREELTYKRAGLIWNGQKLDFEVKAEKKKLSRD